MLTIKEAEQYTKEKGQRLGVSYLFKCARSGRIKAEKIPLPFGGSYWAFKPEDLDAYLASERKPGVKKGSKRQKNQEAPQSDPEPDMPLLALGASV